MNLKIKPPVAILGFGVEGRYAAEFLKAHHITDVTVCDENEINEGDIDRCRLQGIKTQTGPNAFKNLSNFSTIIRSPGVPYSHPSITQARNAGALVTSMTQLTLGVARDRLTAITGSNGKTTTTALAQHILQVHYPDLIVGGNDRKPILQEALDHPNSPILMEVSSFQFADVTHSPHISAVLNITPNHLDWHEDLEDYIHAKNNLIRHQSSNDWCILNANNENSRKLAAEAPSSVFWVGEAKENHYAVWEGDMLVVRHDGESIELLSRDEIKVKTHPDNLLFAVAIAILHGTPPKLIAQQMRTFSGVEHRLEFVRELNGVSFYNDSSCTTPESTEVAIDQFPSDQLILMLGGSSKNGDFSFLASKIKAHNVRVYLYGKEGETIQSALLEAGAEDLILNYNQSQNFEEIIRDVFSLAKSGENIVLSPACASFDMFSNSKDRGYKFKTIVTSL